MGIAVLDLTKLIKLGIADDPQYQSPPPGYFRRAIVTLFVNSAALAPENDNVIAIMEQVSRVFILLQFIRRQGLNSS